MTGCGKVATGRVILTVVHVHRSSYRLLAAIALSVKMTPWPPKVTKRFSTVPANARENDLYGPQSRSVLTSHDSVDSDFVIEFEVLLEDKPVFFLEMRKRMWDLAPAFPLNTLNGVSAFSTQHSFYTYDNQRRLLPARISPHPDIETDTTPLDRWDCNI
ncbi:hypothetical protein EDB84DRAFT_882738 [Lactarius hengduanensis]|nr:hypothetical protein EDB84DRAFT_882738 [Lactarius hengduanensis]